MCQLAISAAPAASGPTFVRAGRVGVAVAVAAGVLEARPVHAARHERLAAAAVDQVVARDPQLRRGAGTPPARPGTDGHQETRRDPTSDVSSLPQRGKARTRRPCDLAASPQDLFQTFHTAGPTPDSKRMPRRHVAALIVLLATLVSGCRLEVRSAMHVTASAATLKAKVHCGGAKHVRFHGRAWWQLRRAGASAWKRVTPKRRFACRKRTKRIVISGRLKGLHAGVLYQYRLAVDPASTRRKAALLPCQALQDRGAAAAGAATARPPPGAGL